MTSTNSPHLFSVVCSAFSAPPPHTAIAALPSSSSPPLCRHRRRRHHRVISLTAPPLDARLSLTSPWMSCMGSPCFISASILGSMSRIWEVR